MYETEMHFASHDGVSNLRALVWEPVGEDAPATPRGIIQILHGMAEHIERYRAFAEACTAADFIVCGHDQIGHGKSIKSPDERGILPPEGMNILIEDAHQLRKLMQERFCSEDAASSEDTTGSAGAEGSANTTGSAGATGLRGTAPSTAAALPYIFFGHSMGSFVVRNYLALHADGVAAAILSGTGHQPAALSNAGSLVARILHAIRGNGHRSKLLFNLSVGGYSKQIENARTPLDWLSTDETVIDAYIASPNCGFAFGTGGNITLTALTANMVKRSTAEAVPRKLPLLFISGDEDPVGEKGVAVERAVALFKDTGHEDVTLILYKGMRHEVLNETGKDQVYRDVLDWIEDLPAFR